MADYTTESSVRPRTGWGEKLGQFFNANVTINNVAASGRSTRSYYNEAGKWDTVKPTIQSGDYVIIQFGHNDQKYDTSYAQYGTYAFCSDGSGDGEACTGAADAVLSSDDKSLHSYYQYLKKYVTEVRAAGGTPILMTPIVRRYFNSGSITTEGQHSIGIKGTETYARGDYPAAMKAVATAYSVPLIDITALSKTIVETYGATAATTPYLFYPDDTHLNPLFATLVAKAAVDGLKSEGVLSSYVVSTPGITTNSSTLAFADTYSGNTTSAFFNAAGYDLSPSTGNVTINAPSGYKISTDQTTWSSSLTVSYSGGAFTKTIYVQFAPTAAQSYTGSISVVLGSTTMASIAVSGTGLAAVAGTTSSGLWPMMSGLLTGTASGLVTVSDAVVSSGIPSSSTTTGTINSTNYTVNRYASVGITAKDATRYIEYSITPTSGTLTVTAISAWLGGSGGSGNYVDIEYSTDNFATSTALATKANPPNNGTSAGYVMQQFSYPGLGVTVASGSTLKLRFYPYYKDTASTNKFLSMANVTIEGAVQ